MASNKLISDYDFIPKKLPEEQIKICESCNYRLFNIDRDLSVGCIFVPKTVPIPACDRDTCSIDGVNLNNVSYFERLLRVYNFDYKDYKSKGG